jgi:hypothetical protein
MSDVKLFELADLEIWIRNGNYYAKYDAGSHLVCMREDLLTEDEAKLALTGNEGALKMLFKLQERLIEMGINPYESNL